MEFFDDDPTPESSPEPTPERASPALPSPSASVYEPPESRASPSKMSESDTSQLDTKTLTGSQNHASNKPVTRKQATDDPKLQKAVKERRDAAYILAHPKHYTQEQIAWARCLLAGETPEQGRIESGREYTAGHDLVSRSPSRLAAANKPNQHQTQISPTPRQRGPESAIARPSHSLSNDSMKRKASSPTDRESIRAHKAQKRISKGNVFPNLSPPNAITNPLTSKPGETVTINDTVLSLQRNTPLRKSVQRDDEDQVPSTTQTQTHREHDDPQYTGHHFTPLNAAHNDVQRYEDRIKGLREYRAYKAAQVAKERRDLDTLQERLHELNQQVALANEQCELQQKAVDDAEFEFNVALDLVLREKAQAGKLFSNGAQATPK